MNKIQRTLSWTLPALAALILLFLHFGYSYQFSEFRVSGPKNRQTVTTLPFHSGSWGTGMYAMEGELHRSWFAPTKFQIIPDDYLASLKINDQPVNLDDIPPNRRRDVNNGFAINLGPYLKQGKNEISLSFQDYGGNIAMNLKPAASDLRFNILLYGWIAVAMWIFIVGAQRAGVSRVHTALYLLVLAGGLIKAAYIFTYNPVDHIWSDPARHWEQGTDLLRSDLMALTDPIGYQLFVAVIAKLTLKIPGLVAFYTLCLALLAPWVWYRFFRELQSNKTLALCGWAFFSLLPSWTSIYAYFMQETLFIPLLGAALWSSWRCRRKSDVRSFGLMVFLWICTGLTRGIAIPMAALVCTWLWLLQDDKLRKAVYSSLILLAVMGPLTWRAYVMVNHFAPHGMGHLNVIYAQSGKKEIMIHSERQGGRWTHIFGSPSTGAKPFEPFSDWQTRRSGKVRVNVDLDEGMRDWKKAMAAQDMSFNDYLWITGENLIFLFFAPSWPDNNHARILDQINSGLRFLWAPIFIALVIGLIVHRRKFNKQWLLPAVIGIWFVVQCLVPISVNEGRYRKPFEGLAVAQIILWIAVARGQARPAAPGTPLGDYWQTSKAWLQRKRGQLPDDSVEGADDVGEKADEKPGENEEPKPTPTAHP